MRPRPDLVAIADAAPVFAPAMQGPVSRWPIDTHPRPTKDFQFIRAAEIEQVEPDFLIAGLLESESLAAMNGAPGAGKSFLALDVAASIALGLPFHGRSTKAGPVCYIASEGNRALRRRLAAYERAHDAVLTNAPLFISRSGAQFLDPESATGVARAVATIAETEGPPRLVIVDTLAGNFGGDENSTQDMTAFVRAMASLIQEFRTTILLVHHVGHGDRSRGRGSSALRAALDAEYLVDASGITIRLSATKMKEAALPHPIAFHLQEIEIGSTAVGEPITSAALVEIEPTVSTRPMTPTKHLALETFAEIARADAGRSVPLEQWRIAFYARHFGDTPDAKRKAFQRARSDLVSAGELTVANDVYTAAGEQALGMLNDER